MKKTLDKLKENKWMLGAVILCLSASGIIIIAAFLLIAHFSDVTSAIGTFIGFFKQVIIGGILAYLVNPVAMAIKKRVFSKTKLKDGGWALSVAMALILVILLILFLLGLVVPQLIDSIVSFTDQFKAYYPALAEGLDEFGIDLSAFGLSPGKTAVSIKDTVSAVSSFAMENGSEIMAVVLGAGHGIVTFAISLILAIYLISAKDEIKGGSIRLLNAVLPEKSTNGIIEFLARCSEIFLHYAYYSLIEGILIGVINAIFMMILGMPYASLVSVVVGITNLIPTVGPVIGCVIGAFVLLIENPMQALIFIVFTIVLQLFDGYILKPKLFGNSLGVSGVLIMVAVVVGGNMFGMLGILLSIPAAAIIDMIYHDYLLKALENRKKPSPEKPPEENLIK